MSKKNSIDEMDLKNLLLDLKQQKEIINKIRTQKCAKNKEIETETIETTNASINDINAKLDIFNERILDLTKTMHRSFADVQINQLLINEAITLVKRMDCQNKVTSKEFSESEKSAVTRESVGVQTVQTTELHKPMDFNCFHFPFMQPMHVPPLFINPYHPYMMNSSEMIKYMNKNNPYISPLNTMPKRSNRYENEH